MFMTVVIAGAAITLSVLGPREISNFMGEFQFPNWENWAIGPFNLLFFGLIGIVILNAGGQWLLFLRWRPLVYLGKISYGLYLYPIPVMFAVDAVFRKLVTGRSPGASRPLLHAVVELTISIMIASLSWRFIEQPILTLKSRFQLRQNTVSIEPTPVRLIRVENRVNWSGGSGVVQGRLMMRNAKGLM
jgi:peptidoglycan/LPS O-acetylase OafA/YrhL